MPCERAGGKGYLALPAYQGSLAQAKEWPSVPLNCQSLHPALPICSFFAILHEEQDTSKERKGSKGGQPLRQSAVPLLTQLPGEWQQVLMGYLGSLHVHATPAGHLRVVRPALQCVPEPRSLQAWEPGAGSVCPRRSGHELAGCCGWEGECVCAQR
eukprot:1158046-Pelagomonas_calceolata.AAC.1